MCLIKNPPRVEKNSSEFFFYLHEIQLSTNPPSPWASRIQKLITNRLIKVSAQQKPLLCTRKLIKFFFAAHRLSLVDWLLIDVFFVLQHSKRIYDDAEWCLRSESHCSREQKFIN